MLASLPHTRLVVALSLFLCITSALFDPDAAEVLLLSSIPAKKTCAPWHQGVDAVRLKIPEAAVFAIGAKLNPVTVLAQPVYIAGSAVIVFLYGGIGYVCGCSPCAVLCGVAGEDSGSEVGDDEEDIYEVGAYTRSRFRTDNDPDGDQNEAAETQIQAVDSAPEERRCLLQRDDRVPADSGPYC